VNEAGVDTEQAPAVLLPVVSDRVGSKPSAPGATTGRVARSSLLSLIRRQQFALAGQRLRRTLPRDLVLLLVAIWITQFVGIGWVLTDSIHTSVALFIKGVTPRRGDLVVFGYRGRSIEHYYANHWLARLRQAVGLPAPSLAGPRRGDMLVKYLIGVPGDRIEVDGRRVILSSVRGRFDMGVAKAATVRGVPLHVIAPTVIPAGFVYVWAPHPDALDSRYAEVGLVPIASFAGKAVPLW
jgi:conjugal transfer pilin signal peptidase TrbI